ncbi:MAG: hypothetical protein R2848_17665 [Thermomicrobiales bacterium]
MSLRLIPGLNGVIRPADADETREAWVTALTSSGPTVLALSRQDLPILDRSGAHGSLAPGRLRPARHRWHPDIVLVATGSEVALALQAADLLQEYDVAARIGQPPELGDVRPADGVVPGKRHGSLADPAPLGRSRRHHRLAALHRPERRQRWHRHIRRVRPTGGKVLERCGFTKEHVAASALRLLDKGKDADKLDAGFAGHKSHA